MKLVGVNDREVQSNVNGDVKRTTVEMMKKKKPTVERQRTTRKREREENTIWSQALHNWLIEKHFT
jgi:hypothetical protein